MGIRPDGFVAVHAAKTASGRGDHVFRFVAAETGLGLTRAQQIVTCGTSCRVRGAANGATIGAVMITSDEMPSDGSPLSTIGIEEEFLLVDPETRAPTPAAEG